MPELAKQNTHEGAAAFTVYWFDMVNWASVSNDTTALEAISTEDCDYCRSVFEGVAESARAGGALEGGRALISDVSFSHTFPDESLIFDLVYSEEAGRVVVPGGGTQKSWDAIEATPSQVVVVWGGEAGWQMGGFGSRIECADC